MQLYNLLLIFFFLFFPPYFYVQLPEQFLDEDGSGKFTEIHLEQNVLTPG